MEVIFLEPTTFELFLGNISDILSSVVGVITDMFGLFLVFPLNLFLGLGVISIAFRYVYKLVSAAKGR